MTHARPDSGPGFERRKTLKRFKLFPVRSEAVDGSQGYFAQKKHPPSLGPPYGPIHCPTVGS